MTTNNSDIVTSETKDNFVTLLPNSVLLTNRSKDRILTLMKNHNFTEKDYLRVGVLGGGCSGFQYKLFFVDTYDEDSDIVIHSEPINIVVNNKAMQFISGLQIDYDDSVASTGWIYSNPQAKNSCGCGTSFSV